MCCGCCVVPGATAVCMLSARLQHRHSMRRILLVRHGECEANLTASSRITGQSPENPLTPLGQRQAQALGKHFSRVCGWPKASDGAVPGAVMPVFSSTAVRASETARIVVQQQLQEGAAAELVQSPELLEIGLGQWEGADRAATYTDAVMADIQRDPFNFAPPGGESLRDVEHRVTRYLRREVLPRVTPGGPPALVVSHGLAIKCLLRGLLNCDVTMLRKFEIGNTSITELAWQEAGSLQGWNILRVNDKSHLLIEGLS